MTIRRVEFWNTKPGRLGDLVAAFHEMKSAADAHVNPRFRLLEVTHGFAGPSNLTAGDCYGIADFDSAAAYGDFLHAARSDESIQEIWRLLHSEESPAIHRSTGLLHKIDEGGAPVPEGDGAVSLVRAWKIVPGMEDVVRAAGEAVQEYSVPLGGHIQVSRPMIAPSEGANVIMSATFPNWSALGRFLDKLNDDPEVQRIVAPFRSAAPPAHLLQVHVATVIAS